MKKTLYMMSIFSFIALVSGCSTKATIYALQPVQVDSLSFHKNITVDTFISDRVNFSSKLKERLSSVYFDGKSYFNLSGDSQTHIRGKAVVHTRDEEYYNEYVHHYNKEGKLLNTDRRLGLRPLYSRGGIPLIVNNYTNNYMNYGGINTYQNNYNENNNDKKTRDKGYDKVEYKYCVKRYVELEGYIDVAYGSQILHHKIFNEETYDDECHNDGYRNDTVSTLAYRLRDRVIERFVKEVTPRLNRYRVKLLKKPDINYTTEQKNALKQALKAVENNNYAQAESLLLFLNNQTSEKSYVALYNLGVIKEAQHQYIDAKRLYTQARTISAMSVDEINNAYARVDNVKYMETKAKLQLNR